MILINHFSYRYQILSKIFIRKYITSNFEVSTKWVKIRLYGSVLRKRNSLQQTGQQIKRNKIYSKTLDCSERSRRLIAQSLPETFPTAGLYVTMIATVFGRYVSSSLTPWIRAWTSLIRDTLWFGFDSISNGSNH